MKTFSKRASLAVAVALLGLCALPAAAQYPNKPIKLVVPFIAVSRPTCSRAT